MKVTSTYRTYGSTALAVRQNMHLRLVYNSTSDKNHTQPREQRAASPHIGLFAAALVIVLVMCAVSTAISNIRHSAAFAAINAQPTAFVAVRAGDSLWTLASRHTVEGVSTNDVVDWIKSSNGLKTSELHPGQRLIAPSQT